MDDLRKGKIEVCPHYFRVDMPFYRKHIANFLPEKVVDIHVHAGTRKGVDPRVNPPEFWPKWVTFGHDMTVKSILDAYIKLLPGKDVSVVCFGSPDRDNVERANEHIKEQSQLYPQVSGFALTLPEWSAQELLTRMQEGGFVGMKSYSNMVKSGKKPEDITVLDIYPHHQLEIAQEYGWTVMLHVPRPGRLADPSNVDQLHEICEKYPDIKIVIAHVGRAYYPEIGRKGLDALKDLDTLYYDISANTCGPVFEYLLDTVDTARILYGSDLPIFAVRGKRIWEGENYINYIHKADWEDSHTRRCKEKEEQFTFMLYEEIFAFKKAAEKARLSRDDIENVFWKNARRLLDYSF